MVCSLYLNKYELEKKEKELNPNKSILKDIYEVIALNEVCTYFKIK